MLLAREMVQTGRPLRLALTANGDLDVSIIDALPPGRIPLKTHVFTDRQRVKVYRRVKRHLDAGRRAFVICPLVGESDKLPLADVERTHGDLVKRMAPHPVGFLHGRLSADEKSRTPGHVPQRSARAAGLHDGGGGGPGDLPKNPARRSHARAALTSGRQEPGGKPLAGPPFR